MTKLTEICNCNAVDNVNNFFLIQNTKYKMKDKFFSKYKL